MEPVIKIPKFETSFGNPLEWELLTEKYMRRINNELQDISVLNEKDWHKMFGIMIQYLLKFKPTFK